MRIKKPNNQSITVIISSGGALGAYAIGFIVELKKTYPNIRIIGSSIGALIGLVYANNLIDDENTFRKLFCNFAGLPNNILSDIDDLFNTQLRTDNTVIDQAQTQDQAHSLSSTTNPNPNPNPSRSVEYKLKTKSKTKSKPINIILTKSEPYFKWLDFFYLNKNSMVKLTVSNLIEQKIAVLLSCRLSYPLNIIIDNLIEKKLDDMKQLGIQIKPNSFIHNWKSFYDGGYMEDLYSIANKHFYKNYREPIIIIDLKKYSWFYMIAATDYNDDINKLNNAKQLYKAGKQDAKLFIINNSIQKCVYSQMLKYIKAL